MNTSSHFARETKNAPARQVVDPVRLAIGKTIHEGAIDGNAVWLRDKSAPVGKVHCFKANEARRLRPWLCHFSIVRRAHRVLALRERECSRAHVYQWHPDITGLDALFPAHQQ
jgi:hypothetical protein